ncbi:hypothetical protein V8F20_000249 [Naviculisporaceae sp. PSN 640]
MSSPDPLTDGVPSSVVARRVTRSQTSQRFYSYKESPRKQTFELDVGNDISPQRIRVTVEADDHSTSGVKRRLFQSPTPKRNMRRKTNATTTTVPLRGLTDDENGAFSVAGTPRRGRPRRSGTPRKPATPAVTRRGRPATPGGRFERSKSVSSRDVLQSDTDAASHRTPRPGSTVKRVVKRKTMTPMKSDDIQSSLPRKRRGRPRKESTLPSEITAMVEQESVADGEVEDNASVAPTEDNASVAGNRYVGGPGAGADFDDDIWLATLSDQATPVARRWHGNDGRGRGSESVEQDLPLPAPQPQPAPSELSDADYSQPEEYMDFGGMEAHSDVESEPNENAPAQDNTTAQHTIMSNEEFTMISIGSLPSMQPNSSMMAPQREELGEATSLIINRTLEELRKSQNRSAQQPSNTEAVPQETIESGEMSPIQQPQEQQDRPLPPLETSLFAQPNPPQSWMRSPRRNKATPLAKQVAKNILQADDIDSPVRPSNVDNQEPQDTSAYDDSFSQIPEAVLEAATPRRPRQPPPPSEDEDEEENAPTDIQPSIERPSIVNHSNPQSESNRLLTPDETPSIPSDDEGTKSQPSASKPAAPAREPEMHSSPPDVHVSPSINRSHNESFQRHSRTRSTETPTERTASFRSPALAALNAQHHNLAPPEPQRRPTLSPIVRAGRALQFITSDPPSPPNRDSVLRSPFRGSVAKSSPPLEQPAARTTQSPPPQAQRETSARPAGRSWLSPFTHIKDLVVQGAQALSPQLPAAPAGVEDPFGPLPNDLARPPSSRSLFSLGNRQTQANEAGAKATSLERSGLFDDDARDNEMSWQAESPSRRSRPSSRDRPRSAGSSVNAARGSSPDDADLEMEYEYEDEMELDQEPEQEPGREPEPQSNRGQSRVDYEQEEEQEEEEEEDIWAIEAQRPTPYTNKQTAPPPAREPSGFPPRRSKLPSPWRKNSRRLVYSDELHQLSDENAAPPRSETDEFSLLSQQNNQPKPALSQPTPHAAAPKKPDLSAFFSSPADLPDPTQTGYGLFNGKNAAKKSAPQPTPLRQQIRSTFQPPPKPQSFGNSLFPQPPREEAAPRQSYGNSLFPPLPREEEPQTRRTQKLPSIPQKEFHVDRANRESSILQSPVRDRSVEPPISERHRSSSPATPERSVFSVVPQKMNFTPRSRNAQNTLFMPPPKSSIQEEAPASSNSLFNSAKRQISAFFASTGRAKSARDDEDEDMQDYDDEEEDQDDSITPPPPPRFNPAPNRAMSPTKSSFRSPMKPKTPGRVVEFTSSTLSPLAQAQARAERRASASPEKEAEPQPQPLRFSSSPSSTSSNMLSQSQWTRDHWLRLDELLQARRKGTLQFQLTVRQGPGAASVGNAIPGGKHHRLLGKQVTTASQSGSGQDEEESMILEAWHLDIVEAFRREILSGAGHGTGSVTGEVNIRNKLLWTDEMLAKRLFALMVGEERRAAGRVDRAERRRRERERERERELERERDRQRERERERERRLRERERERQREREREREREEQTEEIRWY